MRLWWTALLVLIALGGAGLAADADRPHNARQRPELTWRADQNAEPWIGALVQELRLLDDDIVDLSRHGRDVLGRITALDVERMNDALEAGDQSILELEVALGRLATVREAAQAAVDESRLGAPTRSIFDQLTSAAASGQQLTAAWQGLGAAARRVAGLIDAVLRHDGLVFRATTAGRAANWEDALSLLQEAQAPLGEASEIRNGLAVGLNTDTLDDLLERYGAYDAALTALYTYIRDTGRTEGADLDALQAAVDRTRPALATDTSAMGVIVAEAAGPPLTDGLLEMERGRGVILEALTAAESSQP